MGSMYKEKEHIKYKWKFVLDGLAEVQRMVWYYQQRLPNLMHFSHLSS